MWAGSSAEVHAMSINDHWLVSLDITRERAHLHLYGSDISSLCGGRCSPAEGSVWRCLSHEAEIPA